jgi:putative PIN family toxin of toxin-antitoxin system
VTAELLRAVVDANVVVSAVLNPRGRPAEVVRSAGVRFRLVWTAAVVAECYEVLTRPKLAGLLRGREENAVGLVAELAAGAELVPPELLPGLRVVQGDPDDDVLFAVALAGGARFVVSGDGRVLGVGSFGGVEAVTPTEFLTVLRER